MLLRELVELDRVLLVSSPLPCVFLVVIPI